MSKISTIKEEFSWHLTSLSLTRLSNGWFGKAKYEVHCAYILDIDDLYIDKSPTRSKTKCFTDVNKATEYYISLSGDNL